MKRLLALCVVLILVGCVTAPVKVSCPDQEVYFKTTSGIIVMLKKGYFDKENRGIWLDKETFDKLQHIMKQRHGL